LIIEELAKNIDFYRTIEILSNKRNKWKTSHTIHNNAIASTTEIYY
jgi:hypothetical protein